MSFGSSCFRPDWYFKYHLVNRKPIDKTTAPSSSSTCCTLRTNDSVKSYDAIPTRTAPMISPLPGIGLRFCCSNSLLYTRIWYTTLRVVCTGVSNCQVFMCAPMGRPWERYSIITVESVDYIAYDTTLRFLSSVSTLFTPSGSTFRFVL